MSDEYFTHLPIYKQAAFVSRMRTTFLECNADRGIVAYKFRGCRADCVIESAIN